MFITCLQSGRTLIYILKDCFSFFLCAHSLIWSSIVPSNVMVKSGDKLCSRVSRYKQSRQGSLLVYSVKQHQHSESDWIRAGQSCSSNPTPLTCTHLVICSVQRNPHHRLWGGDWLLRVVKTSSHPLLVTFNSALLSKYLKLTSATYSEDPKRIYKILEPNTLHTLTDSSLYL